MPPLRLLRFGALACALSLPAAAQTYYWSAFAGRPPLIGGTDGPAAAALFANPYALVTDVAGVTYVAEASGDRIRRISADGIVSTLAGGGSRGAVNGVGANARFAAPAGVALANGFLFVADRFNHAIRRVSSNGTVTTFAGVLGTSGTNDGGPGSGRFNEPIGIASDGTVLYIADTANHAIRKITPDGEVTTIAGLPGTPGAADGTGTAARFMLPSGIRVGPNGTLYVSDTGNHTIRRISAEGVVTTYAGAAGLPGATNGSALAARFTFPLGLLAYGDNALLICDGNNDCIRLITPSGNVSVYSGRANVPGSRDGPRADARFYVPSGLTFAPDGVLVADSRNQSIRKIADSTFEVTTYAGPGGNFGRQDGVGAEALFNYPLGIGTHSSGDLYVADARGNTIRRISPQGVVTTLVSGSENEYADGPADVARVNYPVGIAVAEDRTVYFCEQQRHTVRALRPDGSLVTLAGTPGSSGVADGNGSAARFAFPSAIALDRAGNLYIADTNNSTIRKIAAGTTTVTTLAGAPGATGTTDASGSAARFRFPQGLIADADGNLIVTDTSNHTLRRIAPDGAVTTFAGLGGSSGSANGAGSAARFSFPAAVAIDAAGQLYVADSGNQLIRRVVGNVVSTIGGSAGIPGYANGSGSNAWFLTPDGIAVDADGFIYVSETGNNIIRRGEQLRAPSITLQPRSLAVVPGSSATLNVFANGGALQYQWRFNGQAITGATNSSYTISNFTTALAGTYSVLVGNSLGSQPSADAVITAAAPGDAGRIVNLSILTTLPAAGQDFTMGFVVAGSDPGRTKPLVIRAAGPSLGAAPINYPGTLDDPKFDLFFGTTPTGSNDNWGGSAALAEAMRAVGAFAFTGTGSRDAALASDFQLGNNSVRVAAAGSGTGAVLAEIYDATPAGAFTASTPRLVNVSVLKHIGSSLTAGFALGGLAAKTVLIRAIGPTLGVPPFGVSGVVADPQLTLFNSTSTKIGENDNWGGTSTLSAAFSRVSAFPLAPGSRDAALLATLEPGTYTVQVTGVGNTTGVALIEIYEMP